MTRPSGEQVKERKEEPADKGVHPTILLVEDDQELLQFEKNIFRLITMC